MLKIMGLFNKDNEAVPEEIPSCVICEFVNGKVVGKMCEYMKQHVDAVIDALANNNKTEPAAGTYSTLRLAACRCAKSARQAYQFKQSGDAVAKLRWYDKNIIRKNSKMRKVYT